MAMYKISKVLSKDGQIHSEEILRCEESGIGTFLSGMRFAADLSGKDFYWLGSELDGSLTFHFDGTLIEIRKINETC